GTVVAFSRELDGEILTFRTEDGRIVDEDSGSVWDVFGTAIEGPRAGQHLGPIVGINHFWFSWAAFRPETRVYLPEEASQSMGAPTSVPASDATSGQNTPLELAGDFEIMVYTGAGELGGERVMFSELFARGKPVAVEMWAGLCASCRRALPEMETAYGLYKDDIVFVALDIGEYTGLGNEEDARALYAELGMSFPTGTILDPAVMSIYRVTGIPTTLYFRPNGELFHRSGGVVPAVVLGEEFAALLAASR
ncbi:MAG: DUF3179 domain-containing protein, partial [Anaerolineae bacterium]|nr:DUF3179 domain-containing protein [Anaerolineae bacterium]